MRCPTKAEVLAIPKSERWGTFDDPGCKSGCHDSSLGGQAPHCLKKWDPLMRCPTKTEVLAVPKSQRWGTFDDPGCKSGCSFPSLGGQAPLCLKKVKRLSREDAAKAKMHAEKAKAAARMHASMAKAAERAQKEADKGAAPGGAAVLIESEVNTISPQLPVCTASPLPFSLRLRGCAAPPKRKSWQSPSQNDGGHLMILGVKAVVTTLRWEAKRHIA